MGSLYTVSINVKGLEALTVEKGEAVLQEAVIALGAFAQDRVTQMANDRLDGARAKRYRDAIRVEKQQHSITISLGDRSVEAMEAGSPSFDIKPGMLRSAKVKQGKKGPYIDVPFEHTVSRRGAGNYVQSDHARGIVKALIKASLADGNQRTAFKGRWSPTSRWRRLADMKVKPTSNHANLVTFRRISEASQVGSWIYPERQGLDIFASVVHEIDAIKESVVADIVKRQGGK